LEEFDIVNSSCMSCQLFDLLAVLPIPNYNPSIFAGSSEVRVASADIHVCDDIVVGVERCLKIHSFLVPDLYNPKMDKS
jgi:hypothetical protein